VLSEIAVTDGKGFFSINVEPPRARLGKRYARPGREAAVRAISRRSHSHDRDDRRTQARSRRAPPPHRVRRRAAESRIGRRRRPIADGAAGGNSRGLPRSSRSRRAKGVAANPTPRSIGALACDDLVTGGLLDADIYGPSGAEADRGSGKSLNSTPTRR